MPHPPQQPPSGQRRQAFQDAPMLRDCRQTARPLLPNLGRVVPKPNCMKKG